MRIDCVDRKEKATLSDGFLVEIVYVSVYECSIKKQHTLHNLLILPSLERKVYVCMLK